MWLTQALVRHLSGRWWYGKTENALVKFTVSSLILCRENVQRTFTD